LDDRRRWEVWVGASVTLTVVEGARAGRRFVYEERVACVVGRAADCDPRIVDDGKKQLVSRHHCLLDINPPDIRIRDFGSLNGTHVNDVEIGRRLPGQTPEEGARLDFRERDLAHGDEIRIGNTVLRVAIVVPDSPKITLQYCGQCGRDVPGGANGRQGEVLCEACRADLDGVVRDVLAAADGHDNGLAALRSHEIVRQLGRGGQGVVYLARHRKSGELSALKVLLPDVAVEARARDRFLREIESLRQLRHPNVVRLHTSGTSGAAFFLACEYCDGGSLTDLLRRRGGRLPIDEAVKIITQVLDGLAYAHSVDIPEVGRGIVHRDVKPDNVLLMGSGEGQVAKVGDFGLAKAFDQAGLSGHTRTGSIAGTVAYMSRVQLIDFKFARPEVDVWATAATLYFMLTGTTPREFPAGADPIMVVLHQPPVPIRERDPSVPPKLAAVIDEALADDPKIRVTSATAFRQAVLDSVTAP
jgi:hypothetical protein